MNTAELSLKLKTALSKYGNLLILIKGSPDPDAIGSSFALKVICDHLGIKSAIYASNEMSLPQNKAIVKDLEIPIHFSKTPPPAEEYDAYSVLDHQSAIVKDISGKIPCAVHIDHHEKIADDEKADFELITEDAGSVSTIMALLLKEMKLTGDDAALISHVSTALLYGIQTDTDNYKHAGQLDYEAMQFLSHHADNNIISKITDFPLSEKMINLLGIALENMVIHKDWLISGIGFIAENYRDSIAIIADFLLQRQNITSVIIFAAIEKNNGKNLVIDASMRTKNENLNLDDLIKAITPEGGGRKYKGAYQVNIDYFINCPDKTLLWDVIKLTTVEALKKKRDMIRIIELKGFYKKLRNKFDNIFKG